MRGLVVAVLSALVIAGCSGSSGGLSGFLIQEGELWDECKLAPMTHPEMQDWADDYNLTSNPGRFSVNELDDDIPGNGTIVAGMLAYFDCGGEDQEVFSVALQFQTPDQAMESGLAFTEGCDDPWPVFVGGSVMALFDFDYAGDDGEVWEVFDTVVAGIKDRTGATLLCEDELNAERNS